MKYFRGGALIVYVMMTDRAYVRSCQYQRIDSLQNKQQNKEEISPTYKVFLFSQYQVLATCLAPAVSRIAQVNNLFPWQ